jgi:hypothetical protein
MPRKGWLLAVLALTASVVGAADTVFLRPGQSLTGEVVYLGDEGLVLSLPGQGNQFIPWEQVLRVEFSLRAPMSGPAPAEVGWNNALFTACHQLAELNPWRTAGIHLGLTWVGYALARYLEDRCGALKRGTLSCVVATLGVAKTLWELFQIPHRRRQLEGEIARLRTLGAAQGYVFRGCYVLSQ